MKIKIMNNKGPKILIDKRVINIWDEVTRQCNTEVATLACCKKEGNIYKIYDAFLFKQQVHQATAEITTEGLSDFTLEMMQKDNGWELWNDMKVWMHSHVNMTTSPSSQDNEQMKLFEQNGYDFFIRLIMNKQGEMRFDLYDYELGLHYEELDYDVMYDEDTDEKIRTISNQIRLLRERLDAILEPDKSLVDDISKEIKSKVTEKKEVYKYNTYGGYNYNSYGKSYGKPVTKQGNKNNVSAYFNTLSDEEIFEAMILIETGETSAEIFVNSNFTVEESLQLDDLIEDYCNTNINKYLNYAEMMYN